ncbi:MAG: hypothetical protein WCJ64_03915 [Rhodospirillaceae bacterium]
MFKAASIISFIILSLASNAVAENLYISEPNVKSQALGYGTKSCASFLKEAESTRNQNLPYYQGYFTTWTTGFLAGYNTFNKGHINDILENTDINAAMMWIEDYCKKHYEANYTSAVVVFISHRLEDNPKTFFSRD